MRREIEREGGRKLLKTDGAEEKIRNRVYRSGMKKRDRTNNLKEVENWRRDEML